MGLCSMSCGSLDGRGVWGEWTHASVWLSAFASLFPRNDRDIVNLLYPNTKLKVQKKSQGHCELAHGCVE